MRRNRPDQTSQHRSFGQTPVEHEFTIGYQSATPVVSASAQCSFEEAIQSTRRRGRRILRRSLPSTHDLRFLGSLSAL